MQGMYSVRVGTHGDAADECRALIYYEKAVVPWLVDRFETIAGTQRAQELVWELLLLERLDFDILVLSETEVAGLSKLAHPAVEGGGALAPRPALTTIETYLRARGQYVVHIAARYKSSVDSTLFYVHLAGSQLPLVLHAFRSCLSPSRRHEYVSEARQLEAVMARQHDLCVAIQNLRKLHLEEGLLGGSFALLSQQLYHFHAALTLAVGTLDILAGWVADATGVKATGMTRSWSKMLEKSGPWKAAEGDAQRLIEHAATHRLIPFTKLLLALRNVYQHEGMLNAGLAHIPERTPSGRVGRLIRARFAVLLLHQALSGRPRDLDHLASSWKVTSIGRDYGIRSISEEAFVALPHLLAEAIAEAVAELANHLIGLRDWPDADWVSDDEEVRTQVALIWGRYLPVPNPQVEG